MYPKMVDKHIQITATPNPKFVKSCIFIHRQHVLKCQQDMYTCLLQ